MVAVAQIHAPDAVEVMLEPLFMITDSVWPVDRIAAGAMRFDISLIYHIEPIKITPG